MSKGKLIGVTVLAVFAVSIAGLITLTQAGSDAPAPLVVETSTATIPPFVPTPPTAIDCKAPPPSGWIYTANDGGSCSVTNATPNPCAPLRINGRDVCGPVDANGEFCCTGASIERNTIRLGGSKVSWTSTPKNGGREDVITEWNVLPEHEDEFADLKAALLPFPSTAP